MLSKSHPTKGLKLNDVIQNKHNSSTQKKKLSNQRFILCGVLASVWCIWYGISYAIVVNLTNLKMSLNSVRQRRWKSCVGPLPSCVPSCVYYCDRLSCRARRVIYSRKKTAWLNIHRYIKNWILICKMNNKIPSIISKLNCPWPSIYVLINI